MKKNIAVKILIISLISTLLISCKGDDNQIKNDNYITNEKIEKIYYDNKEAINKIKDELFPKGEYLIEEIEDIHLFYKNNELFFNDNLKSEKLQSIENIRDIITNYFENVDSDYNPTILFGVVYLKYITIQFNFVDKITGANVGIIYKTTSELWGEVHLEDDWYIYKYRMD